MKKTTTRQLAALLLSASFALPASAASILAWSGVDAMNTATGDITLSVGTPTDQGNVRNFVPGTPIMSTSIDSTYTENSIYGVIQTHGASGPVDLDTAGSSMSNSATQSLWLGVDGDNPGAAAIRQIASLVWFDLDVAAGATDYIDTMSVSLTNGGALANASLRFAIQSGGNWYVSGQNITAAGSPIAYDGSNFAALAVATSSSTALMTGVGLNYAGGSLVADLDNITAVGVFLEGATTNTTNRARVKLDAFNATTVPEPGTAVLGLLGVALLFRRRKS